MGGGGPYWMLVMVSGGPPARTVGFCLALVYTRAKRAKLRKASKHLQRVELGDCWQKKKRYPDKRW